MKGRGGGRERGIGRVVMNDMACENTMLQTENDK